MNEIESDNLQSQISAAFKLQKDAYDKWKENKTKENYEEFSILYQRYSKLIQPYIP